jgi:hypothetical protein
MSESRVCPTCKQKIERGWNLWKFWALMAVYDSVAVYFFDPLSDISFLMQFVGFWVTCLLVVVTLAAWLNRRFHVKQWLKR